ncbi:pectate lyase [Symbioplanes lichenis]|uniref:pectate lyase n=1 Tax=Symbioplanes lichenis TaxID=1629072 RepID=UPI002739FDAE|nr:pectate lyase [Actinoplanes lichenis]
MTHAGQAQPGGRRRRRAAVVGGFAAVVVAAAGITATAFADSTSLSATFEDGGTSGWAKSGGSWSVVADDTKVLRQANAGSALARMFAGDEGWADYSLQARVKAVSLTGAGTAGIAARATGSSQFERLVLVPGAVRLEEVRGSSVTVLGSATLASAATAWHTLRVDVSGSSITGYADGVKVASGTVGAKFAKGRVGLVTTTASASFDDVKVSTSAAAPTPTVTASPSPTKTASPTPSPTKTASPTATAAPVASKWPTATKTEKLSATKKITGSFDGGNTQFVGTGDLGGDGQEEGQDALFDLADGATLSNVILGSPAADGVHCLGTCTLTNVWWLDVGEDAATFKGTSAGQTMTINGGGAKSASDKTFQHNGPGTMIIKNFQAENIGKLYRSCGNCSKQYARHVQVLDVTITAPVKAVVGINPNLGDTAVIDGLKLVGDTAKTDVCALFKGVTSGEPTQVGDEPDGVSCKASHVTKG